MIRITRLNRVPLILNADLIEYIEATPDTVISLTTGQKVLVLESADEIVGRVVEFRRRIGVCAFLETGVRAGSPAVAGISER